MTRMTRITVKVGTTFNSHFADSNPTWRVVSSRGGNSWNCKVVSDDWEGRSKVFGTEEIVSAIRYARTLANLSESHDDWWNSRTYGETVHYHGGFGQFVRGIVVERDGEKKMLPVALVGNWSKTDLPYRRHDGTVYYSYHVKKIRFPDDDSAMQPHESNMWESPSFSRRNVDDPSSLESIDLSDPAPLEGDAAEQARYEKIRMYVQTLMGDGYRDPRAALIIARDAIDDVLRNEGEQK